MVKIMAGPGISGNTIKYFQKVLIPKQKRYILCVWMVIDTNTYSGARTPEFDY